MDERLKRQLDFALEIDKEKNIFRQTHLSGHGRQENDAEHAWHMAVMAYLLREYANLNWVPFVFGVALVGLEMGYIYAYKAGWPVSAAAIVQSSFLAVALLVAGFFLYHEPISLNKVAGIFICMVGLYFINK